MRTPGSETVGNGLKQFKMEASPDRYHRFLEGNTPSKGDWVFLFM